MTMNNTSSAKVRETVNAVFRSLAAHLINLSPVVFELWNNKIRDRTGDKRPSMESMVKPLVKPSEGKLRKIDKLHRL